MNDKLDRDLVTPLYHQIKDVLLERIEKGQFPCGKMLPSIRELSSEFGVAVFTVRKALDLLASDGIIGKRAGRGSFVVSGGKQGFPRPKEKRAKILFLSTQGNIEWEQYSSPIKQELEQVLARAAFRLQYGPVHPGQLELFLEENMDESSAVVLWDNYDLVKESLVRYELPAVLCAWDPEAVDGEYVKDVVNFDGYSSILAMTKHLTGLGHRRVAMIHAPITQYDGRRRLQAYRDAMRAAGVTPRAEYAVHGEYTMAAGRKAMHQLLSLDDRPTAVVCHNDYMALGAMSEIASVGLRIPEDVSITGFDDIEASEHAHPALTTARIDRALLGGTLARLMVERLANPRKPFTAVNIEAQIKFRESCALPSE